MELDMNIMPKGNTKYMHGTLYFDTINNMEYGGHANF
jgi:hypothetical protein